MKLNHYRILLLSLGLVTVCFSYSLAQDEKQAAIQALKRLATVYKSSMNLSFNAAFYYADEKQPHEILDSLQGKFKISGNNYWYALANTEIISDGQFAVILYKEDSLMYLTRSSAATQSINPVALIDSFLVHNTNLNLHSRTNNGQQMITIDFPANGPYKSIVYTINPKTGFVVQMRSIVKSDQLLDPGVRAAGGSSPGYAIVDVVLNNYKVNEPGSNIFSMSNYFKKEGKEYVTVAPYNTYKIFLGSPDL